jgi:hypothetical protein
MSGQMRNAQVLLTGCIGMHIIENSLILGGSGINLEQAFAASQTLNLQ